MIIWSKNNISTRTVQLSPVPLGVLKKAQKYMYSTNLCKVTQNCPTELNVAHSQESGHDCSLIK